MNCIFGIFDVLGFTSFCEHCGTLDAEKVFRVMDNFEAEIPEILLHGLYTEGESSKEKIDSLKKRLRWLTFSDTIFVALPFELSDKPNNLKFTMIFFTTLAAYINRKMFEMGLPVRGTLHIGDAIMSRRCFAGKAIMDAHRLSGKCQVAATVVSDQTCELLSNLFPEPRGCHFMYANMILECDVPVDVGQLPGSLLCANKTQKMKTLCWFFLDMGRIEPFGLPPDLESYVERKFTAHGKKLLGERERMKAINTVDLFKNWKTICNGRRRHHVSITA